MNGNGSKLVMSVSLNMLLVIVSAFVIFLLGQKAYTFGYNIFNEQAVDAVEQARETEVTINSNVSASELAKIIYDKGLVKDETIFYLQVKLSDYDGKFKAGTYTLNTSMKPTDIMKELSKSKKGTEE